MLVLVLVCALAGVVAVALFLASDDDDGRPRSAPCETVVAAAQEFGQGARSRESMLELVQEQEAVAQADARRDARLQPVADAMQTVRTELEAGPRLRSMVVLYGLCA